MPHLLRIMLVDDKPMARRGFAPMLRRSPDLVVAAEASNGQEAIDLLTTARKEAAPLPDVSLMDVRMPVLDGIETKCRITRRTVASPERSRWQLTIGSSHLL